MTTASCIDFPQQQQVVDICDNRDGSLSIFAVTLDHASPPQWTPGDLIAGGDGLAEPRAVRRTTGWPHRWPLGSPLDRNVELLLAEPFPLSTISDASVESETVARRAAVLKNTGDLT